MLKKNLLWVMMIMASLGIYAQSSQIASVGKFIPEEDASRWIDNFKNKFPDAPQQQVVDKGMLNILLQDQRLEGIYFYNVIDQGKQTLALIGCGKNGELLSCSGSATEFQKQHPMRSHAQLVGRDILTALLATDDCVSIIVMGAVDDNRQERIVYAAADANGKWLTNAADGSLPCPPYCAGPGPRPLTVVVSELE